MEEPIKEPLPQEEEPPRKLKVICRFQNARYTEQYVNEGDDYVTEAAAGMLLSLFNAEMLTRQLTEACGPESVVVFRTDSRQMKEFRTLLQEHDTPIK